MAATPPFEVLNEIRTTLKTLEGQNFYERLGVPQDSAKGAITKAYMKLAAKWHPDKFSKYDLGKDQTDLQRLFALVSEAHSTLTSARKKEEYDLKISMGDGADEADQFRDLFGVDNNFRLGEQLLERGQIKPALAKFQTACKLNPSSERFEIYHIYCEFALAPRDSAGKSKDPTKVGKGIARIKACMEELEEFDMGYLFVARMYMALGEERTAVRNLKSALSLNRKNVHAQRDLRLYQQRQEAKSQNGGLFGKIASFFKRS